MTNAQIEAEINHLAEAWDSAILASRDPHRFDEAQARFGERFAWLNAEMARRKVVSAPAVVRLRFLAGETGRQLDAACGEALGWRVGRDPWWNWHEGPRFEPPGDEWCIRRDGRNDIACDEALPHFTAESFDRELRIAPPKDTRNAG